MKSMANFRNVFILIIFLISGVLQAVIAQNESMDSTFQILKLQPTDYKPVNFRIGATLGFGLNTKEGRFSTLLENRLKGTGYGDTYYYSLWDLFNINYPVGNLVNLTPVSIFADVYIFKHWTAGLALNGFAIFDITGYNKINSNTDLYITSKGNMLPIDLRIGIAAMKQTLMFAGGPTLIITNFEDSWWNEDNKNRSSIGYWMGAEYTLPQKKVSGYSFVLKMHYRRFSPTEFGGGTQIYYIDGQEYTHSISAFKESFHTINLSFGMNLNRS